VGCTVAINEYTRFENSKKEYCGGIHMNEFHVIISTDIKKYLEICHKYCRGMYIIKIKPQDLHNMSLE
jgi:hypothetical protein